MKATFSLGPLFLAVLTLPLLAQAPTKDQPTAKALRSPRENDIPLAQKLKSPRDTLKTLYYAVGTYDLFPAMIEDAILCLDLEGRQPQPNPEEAGLLALELERILQALDLPLRGVPEATDKEIVVLHENGPARISLRRCPDTFWRFDTVTIESIPVLRRIALERYRSLQTEQANLREGFTDARATMRQFMIDCRHGDYYAAARALDLSYVSSEQRRERGPILAHQLAFVIQHRGFVYSQEVSNQPNAPPFIWHADKTGRISLERIRQADGKDAWMFSRQTLYNLPRMYEAALGTEPNSRYVRLGFVIPPVRAGVAEGTVQQRPEDVPPHLNSPRTVLRGFFRTMDAADANDSKLSEALEYLDLKSIPVADRSTLGGKTAAKLEVLLRKSQLDLSAVPDDWNAPPQVLGAAQGFRIEIVRQRDGCWRFSEATVSGVPAMFDKLAGKDRADRDRSTTLESARDTMTTFLTAINQHDNELAARCLNLSGLHPGSREDLGRVLAFKLKYVLDRLGRIYLQEIPDEPDGPRYVVFRGEHGRIVLARKTDEPDKGTWQFTPDTVRHIEKLFRAVMHQPMAESLRGEKHVLQHAVWYETPGVCLRMALPQWTQQRIGSLDLYQWIGLAIAGLGSCLLARLVLSQVYCLFGWLLHHSGSELSHSFVATKLRPLTWLTSLGIFFFVLEVLDLPIAAANEVLPLKKFILAGLVGWLGFRLVDLSMAIYMNSELIRPHRSLSDMIVPVGMRMVKGLVLLVVATYVIFQIGEGDLLGRFLTGLGFAGLAASLAAQDAMKSFFGTLLLISERAFKIGDRIIIGAQEGTVEQVGFRSTRLRTSEDSLLTVPNSTIATASIDNMGARVSRRYKTSLVISYSTPLERVTAFRDEVRAWLMQHPCVNRSKVDFAINRFTDAGVEMALSVYLLGVDGAEESRVREEILSQVLRMAKPLQTPVAVNDGTGIRLRAS